MRSADRVNHSQGAAEKHLRQSSYDWDCNNNSGVRLFQHLMVTSVNGPPPTPYIFFPLYLLSLYFILLYPLKFVMWTGHPVH